jgi:hypothetical protein
MFARCFVSSHCLYDIKTVHLQTSPAGELALRADSESSCVRTFFGKLTPSNRNPVAGNREPCSLKVDTKMLVGSNGSSRRLPPMWPTQ